MATLTFPCGNKIDGHYSFLIGQRKLFNYEETLEESRTRNHDKLVHPQSVSSPLCQVM